MSDQKVWMTSEGYQRLGQQLEELRAVKRPALVERLREVRGDADWRENTQMIQVQYELNMLDSEINRLTEMIEHGVVVEPHWDNAMVDIGETVVVQMNGDIETYTIVSPSEIAPDSGRISYESPVGHALLKHKVGDDVDVAIPDGQVHLRIVAVR